MVESTDNMKLNTQLDFAKVYRKDPKYTDVKWLKYLKPCLRTPHSTPPAVVGSNLLTVPTTVPLTLDL